VGTRRPRGAGTALGGGSSPAAAAVAEGRGLRSARRAPGRG